VGVSRDLPAGIGGNVEMVKFNRFVLGISAGMMQKITDTFARKLQLAECHGEGLRSQESTAPGLQHLKMVAGVNVTGSTKGTAGQCHQQQLRFIVIEGGMNNELARAFAHRGPGVEHQPQHPEDQQEEDCQAIPVTQSWHG